MKRWVPVVLIFLGAVLGGVFLFKGCHQKKTTPAPVQSIVPIPSVSPAVPVSSPVPASTIIKAPTQKSNALVPPPIAKPSKNNHESPTTVSPIEVTPAPAEIYRELIPKDIEIVRVYYSSELMGPGSQTEFDINGTGFTKEFQQMITADSGLSSVQVKNLSYVTLNQIHGSLIVASTCPTSVGYPQVNINGKVVFRAPEPYAVIRPGEVLNVLFTEMGESGRSGRFRIYTNLTPEMFSKLTVTTSTAAIQITDLTPQLPFIVDATIQIGPALTGEYAMAIRLADKTIWERPGVIRIVQPDISEAGLVQRLRATNGFYRPGDHAQFVIQGSGFRPQDTNLLKTKIPGLPIFVSTWTFVAPGRLDLQVDIPDGTPVNTYTIQILQGEKTLLTAERAFTVVPENWIRSLRVDPALTPGGSSALIIEGRDLSADFIHGLTFAFDEPGLTLESCQWMDATKAVAGIKAGADVNPGDYLLQIKSNGAPVIAFGGNVVRVTKK